MVEPVQQPVQVRRGNLSEMCSCTVLRCYSEKAGVQNRQYLWYVSTSFGERAPSYPRQSKNVIVPPELLAEPPFTKETQKHERRGDTGHDP